MSELIRKAEMLGEMARTAKGARRRALLAQLDKVDAQIRQAGR